MNEPPESSSADDIVRWSFLVLFARDDVLDAEELEFLERLALRDGLVDEEEREVLGHIFDRLDPHDMEPEVLEELEEFKTTYGIS